MSYKSYSVQLTKNQKLSLAKAYRNNQAIVIRLKNSQLKGNDELMLTKTQIGKINKSLINKTGLDLKISKSQIRKVAQKGGSLLTTLMSLGSKLIPLATKIAPKILSGLATGSLGALGDITMKQILGKGIQNRPRTASGNPFFRIENKKLPQLSNILNLLTSTQRKEYNKALKIGSGLNIKLNKSQQQNGGLLGILASIAIPILLKALTGGNQKAKGIQNRPVNYQNMNPPPFIGTWKGKGLTKKKTKKKTKTGSGLILGKNSPFKNIPILGAIF